MAAGCIRKDEASDQRTRNTLASGVLTGRSAAQPRQRASLEDQQISARAVRKPFSGWGEKVAGTFSTRLTISFGCLENEFPNCECNYANGKRTYDLEGIGIFHDIVLEAFEHDISSLDVLTQRGRCSSLPGCFGSMSIFRSMSGKMRSQQMAWIITAKRR
jgi:hypothetical protein